MEVGLFILIVLIQLVVLLPEDLALPLPSAGELWLPQMCRKVYMAMILAEDQVESLLDSWKREGRADVGLDELLLFLSQSGSLQHHPAGDLLRKIDLVLRDLSEGLVELGGVLQDRLVLLAPQLEEELLEVGRHFDLGVIRPLTVQALEKDVEARFFLQLVEIQIFTLGPGWTFKD